MFKKIASPVKKKEGKKENIHQSQSNSQTSELIASRSELIRNTE